MSSDDDRQGPESEGWSGPPTEPLHPARPPEPSVYESLYRPQPGSGGDLQPAPFNRPQDSHPGQSGSYPSAQPGSYAPTQPGMYPHARPGQPGAHASAQPGQPGPYPPSTQPGPQPPGYQQPGYQQPGPQQPGPQQPGYQQPDPDRPQRGRTGPLLIGLGVGIALTALVAVAVFWFTGNDDRATVAPTPSPPAQQTAEPAPPPEPSTQPSVEPSETQPAPTTSAPSATEPTMEPFPASATVCPVTGPAHGNYARSAAGTSATSCEFAESVRHTYGLQSKRGDGVVIEAYSPVTEVTYTMTCNGDGLVTCRGGNNAVVYLGA